MAEICKLVEVIDEVKRRGEIYRQIMLEIMD